MYIGWLKLGGTELVNAERTGAYVEHQFPILPLTPQAIAKHRGLRHAIGDDTYESPLLDDAPWVDQSDPSTYGFYGLFPLSFDNFTSSTRTAATTESIVAGGSTGSPRHASRQVRIRGLLLAQDELSLESGMTWLRAALAAENCGEDADLCWFAAFPEVRPGAVDRTKPFITPYSYGPVSAATSPVTQRMPQLEGPARAEWLVDPQDGLRVSWGAQALGGPEVLEEAEPVIVQRTNYMRYGSFSESTEGWALSGGASLARVEEGDRSFGRITENEAPDLRVNWFGDPGMFGEPIGAGWTSNGLYGVEFFSTDVRVPDSSVAARVEQDPEQNTLWAELTMLGPATPATVTASFWVSQFDHPITVSLLDENETPVAVKEFPPVTELWQRLQITGPGVAGGRLRVQADAAEGAVLLISAPLLEEAETWGEFFHGGFADSVAAVNLLTNSDGSITDGTLVPTPYGLQPHVEGFETVPTAYAWQTTEDYYITTEAVIEAGVVVEEGTAAAANPLTVMRGLGRSTLGTSPLGSGRRAGSGTAVAIEWAPNAPASVEGVADAGFLFNGLTVESVYTFVAMVKRTSQASPVVGATVDNHSFGMPVETLDEWTYTRQTFTATASGQRVGIGRLPGEVGVGRILIGGAALVRGDYEGPYFPTISRLQRYSYQNGLNSPSRQVTGVSTPSTLVSEVIEATSGEVVLALDLRSELGAQVNVKIMAGEQNVVLAQSVVDLPAGWSRYVVPTSYGRQVRIQLDSSGSYDIDNVDFGGGNLVLPYFDGDSTDMPGEYQTRWLGLPGRSASRRNYVGAFATTRQDSQWRPFFTVHAGNAPGLRLNAQQYQLIDVDACVEDYERHFHGVSAISGPTPIGDDIPLRHGAAREVEFFLSADSPFAYGAIKPVLRDTAGSLPMQRYEDPLELEAVLNPLIDPDCPPIPEPPRAPKILDACFDTTLPAWTRRWVEIPRTRVSSWSATVPVITFTTGPDPIRQLRVRMHANPFDHAPEQIDPTSFCSEFIVSYLPPDTTLTMDGRTGAAVAQVAGGAPEPATHLLYGTNGAPMSWPELSCGIPYVMTIDTPPVENDDLSIDLALARRE